MAVWEQRKVLITVRTYPTPASRGVEVSCTAGITEQGRWIRLFPVPYRFLKRDQRFRKYQWIEASVTKASDPRPESYTVDVDSVRPISPVIEGWARRWPFVKNLVSHCMCCLKEDQENGRGATLGLFRPKEIRRLVIRKERPPDWTEKELAKLRQYTIFEHSPRTELVKLPFKFSYEYQCDHPTCTGHTMKCTDWEWGASYLNWRDSYGDDWEQAFRNRYEREMIELKDTHLYVGTVNTHPKEWIIVGLWYPPKPTAAPQEGEQGLLL